MRQRTIVTYTVEPDDTVLAVKHPNSVSVGISQPSRTTVWLDWQPCDEHIEVLRELVNRLSLLQRAAAEAQHGVGWAGEPHDCECATPNDSCPACSEVK